MHELLFEELSPNDKLHPGDYRFLLSLAVAHPTEEKLNEILSKYEADPRFKLFLCRAPKGQLMAIAGIEKVDNGIFIRHFAISLEVKFLGLGKWLLDELTKKLKPTFIAAETDDETAVNFYRNAGFKVQEIRSNNPYLHKFHCELLL